MLKIFVLGSFQENCYILYNENSAIIIDPGDQGQRITKFLEENNLTIKAVLLTHGHIDHIGALAYLSLKYNFITYIHEEDSDFLNNPSLNLSLTFTNTAFKYEKAVKTFVDQEVLSFDDFVFKCHHLPGHTPGSTIFEWVGHKTMFTGDVIFKDSVGRYDLPLGSHYDTKQSMLKLKMFDENYLLYPGHGIYTSLDDEKRNNIFLKN